ncbi:MAG TPA: hypothetical protein PKA63_07390 [Oligoflexia bacterium]|nr:hypothetical protein [Oligoflexia bacterium]HMP48473.1 hypothetical protein [Oligoflexia bacterium]
MRIDKAIKVVTELDDVSRRTLYLELLRSVAVGILDTGVSTFYLLYMERVLNTGVWPKAFIAGGASIGLLLSPLVVQLVAGLGLLSSRGAASVYFISGLATAITFVVKDPILITVLLVISMASWNTSIPLTTQIYADNYPGKRRGVLFSLSNMTRILSTALFAYYAGLLLELSLDFFALIIGLLSVMSFFSAWLLFRYPSRVTKRETSNALLDGLRAVRFDKVFRVTLIGWMIMGFGNLMIYPLRVEYLANPIYGLDLGEWRIAMLVTVIPSCSRFVCTFFWGMLFDRVNFFTLRILMNFCFILGMLSFFLSSSFLLLSIGAAVYGIATSGGDVAWNLWVTKFAPQGKSQAYMAVHTFFTGVRGVLAPMVGFYCIFRFGFQNLLWGSTLLVVLASLIFLMERVKGRDLGA